jgi:hypothetical protein
LEWERYTIRRIGTSVPVVSPTMSSIVSQKRVLVWNRILVEAL